MKHNYVLTLCKTLSLAMALSLISCPHLTKGKAPEKKEDPKQATPKVVKAEDMPEYKAQIKPGITRILAATAIIDGDRARIYSDNELNKKTEPNYTLEQTVLVNVKTLANGDISMVTPLSFYVRNQPVTAEAEWIIKKADLTQNAEGKYELNNYKGTLIGFRLGGSERIDQDIFMTGTWSDTTFDMQWDYTTMLYSKVVITLTQKK